MSDPSPEDLAEADRWMREAEEELAVAARIASEPDLPGRVACFHSHLAAEKAIKSLQIRRAVPVRKNHNLVRLVRELQSEDSGMFAANDLNLLNPWTIDGRYPTDHEAVWVRRCDTERRKPAVRDTESGGVRWPAPRRLRRPRRAD